jgi:hypothetical protein
MSTRALPASPTTLEDRMIGRLMPRRDPFEGSGARRTHLRLRIEGLVAFTLATTACGLAAAMWVWMLLPNVGRALLR